jgi:hypothetical protein
MDETFDPKHIPTCCDYDLSLSQDTAHRIDITLRKNGQSGSYYRVVYAGQTLVESTKEPLFDACRALVALGHAGRLEMWGSGSRPCMIVHDMEQGAKLTVVENVNAGPRFAQYRPHPGVTDGDDAE